MIDNMIEELRNMQQRYESYAQVNTLDKEVYYRNYYMAQGIKEAIDLINNMR
jgi:hypothetical protein